MFCIQVLVYLLFFTATIVAVVLKGPVGGLFFYPKPVQQTLCILLYGQMVAADKYPDLFPDKDAGNIRSAEWFMRVNFAVLKKFWDFQLTEYGPSGIMEGIPEDDHRDRCAATVTHGRGLSAALRDRALVIALEDKLRILIIEAAVVVIQVCADPGVVDIRQVKDMLEPLMTQRIDDHAAVIVRLSSDVVDQGAEIKQVIGFFGFPSGHLRHLRSPAF
jgi:hypothetical protein